MAMEITVIEDFRMNSVKKPSGGRLGLDKKWISGDEKTLIAKYVTLTISELALMKLEPKLPA